MNNPKSELNDKKLVIFGSGDIAELAHYYFTSDSEYSVVAFSVDRSHFKENSYLGLPVVPFEEVESHFPPNEYSIFIALSYSKVNQVRKDRYFSAKQKGYQLASYISSHATVLNQSKIGENCFILEDNTIQPFVEIGDNVTLWSGNHIGHHSKISDHVFIASHVVVSGGVTVLEQCFLGVNATLRDHIEIGAKSVIGAGVLLLKSCPEESLVIGAGSKPSSRKSSQLRKI